MKRGSRSQSFLEYAILIAVVVGALIAMRIFMTRSVQEKFRQGSDVFGSGEQYAKGQTRVTNSDGSLTDSPVIPPHDPVNPCIFVVNHVAALENALNNEVYDYVDAAGIPHIVRGLRALAEDYGNRAAELEAQAQELIAQGLAEQAAPLVQNALDLRRQQQEKTQLADSKEREAADFRMRYPECFP